MVEVNSSRNDFPRREMPRHNASMQVSFHYENKSLVGTLVNVSITGAMLMGCQPVAPNSTIIVNLPDVGQLSATVVWNNGEALGLSFENGGNTKESIDKALSKAVNSLPEQDDRRYPSQYAQTH